MDTKTTPAVNQDASQPAKSFLFSRTFWIAVLGLLVAPALKKFGIVLDDAAQQQTAETIIQVMTFAGVLWARKVATGPLTFSVGGGLPPCPACGSNTLVVRSAVKERGKFFCPCNKPRKMDGGYFTSLCIAATSLLLGGCAGVTTSAGLSYTRNGNSVSLSRTALGNYTFHGEHRDGKQVIAGDLTLGGLAK